MLLEAVKRPGERALGAGLAGVVAGVEVAAEVPARWSVISALTRVTPAAEPGPGSAASMLGPAAVWLANLAAGASTSAPAPTTPDASS